MGHIFPSRLDQYRLHGRLAEFLDLGLSADVAFSFLLRSRSAGSATYAVAVLNFDHLYPAVLSNDDVRHSCVLWKC